MRWELSVEMPKKVLNGILLVTWGLYLTEHGWWRECSIQIKFCKWSDSPGPGLELESKGEGRHLKTNPVWEGKIEWKIAFINYYLKQIIWNKWKANNAKNFMKDKDEIKIKI